MISRQTAKYLWRKDDLEECGTLLFRDLPVPVHVIAIGNNTELIVRLQDNLVELNGVEDCDLIVGGMVRRCRLRPHEGARSHQLAVLEPISRDWANLIKS